MKKSKILLILLAAGLLTAAALQVSAEETLPGTETEITQPEEEIAVSDFTCEINEDDATVAITGYTGTETDVVIPQTIDDKPVTVIGAEAFRNNDTITSVVFPDGLTEIGYRAFDDCDRLTRIDIPASVHTIRAYAFRYCDSLKSAYFYGDVPSDVGYDEETGKYTNIFYRDYYTGSYYYPSSFLIYYPDGNTSGWAAPRTTIGDYSYPSAPYAFTGEPNAESDFTWLVNANGTTVTLTGYTGARVNVVIPETFEGKKVTAITASTFSENTELRSVTMPDTVTNIGTGAFKGCTKLETADLSENLTTLGSEVFYNCDALESIVIPEKVTEIPDSAFYDCNSLKEIAIPASVKSIGSSAFWRCYNLETATLEEGMENIGYSAFYDCDSLKEITIPASVNSIESIAFCSCDNLEKVIIPSSVTSTGYDIFDACPKLKTAGHIGGGYNIEFGWTDSIPADAFNDAEIEKIVIPDGVTAIGGGAFSSCSSLSDVTIPSSVSTISDNTFYDCTKIQSAGSLDSGCSLKFGWTKEIPANAFRGLSALYVVHLPDMLETIGASAFSGCTYLSNLVMPASVTSIGESAFSGCTALVTAGPLSDQANGIEYNIQYKWAESIAEGAFSGANALTTVVLPDGIMEIPARAFDGCTTLEEVELPDTVTSIGEYAFRNCDALQTIKIPDTVTSIGEYAFCDCNTITEIIIPDNVTVIEDYAFCGCGSLGKVTLPKKLKEIGVSAFRSCTSLTRIDIPAGVNTIEAYAFADCTSLESAYFYGDVPTEVGYRPDYGSSYSVFSNNASNFSIYYPASNTSGWTTPTTELGNHSYPALPFTVENCEHSYDSVVTAPTCEDVGYTRNICNNCGDIVIVEGSETDALGHDYSTVLQTTEPTCRIWGSTEYQCTNCDSTTWVKNIKPIEHTYVLSEVIAPTCTEDGYTLWLCSMCECEKETDYIDAHGHHFTASESFPATCTERPYTLSWCVLCEKNIKSYTGRYALGHDYGEWKVTVSPTASAEGLKYRICSRCEETEVKTLHPLTAAHTYNITVVDATCTEQGYVTYTCTGCDYSYNDHYTPLTEHDFSKENTVKATCEREGRIYRYCYECEYEETISILPKTDHNMGESVSIANCIREGKTYKYCRYCDYEEILSTTPALGHNFVVISTVEASCDKAGYDNLECTRCKELTVGNIVTVPHTATAWVIDEPATETTEGSMHMDCAVCFNTYDRRPVPRLIPSEESGYVVEGTWLKNVPADITAAELIEAFAPEIGEVKIYSADGKELTGKQYVTAGCEVRLVQDDVVFDRLVVAENESAGGRTITGRITSYGDNTAAVTVELYRDSETTVYRSDTVCGNDTTYTLTNVMPGTYQLKVSKANHVMRVYQITVE